jgi:hypothetical protein
MAQFPANHQCCMSCGNNTFGKYTHDNTHTLNLDRQALFNSYQLPQVPKWDPKILRMIMLPTIASMED